MLHTVGIIIFLVLSDIMADQPSFLFIIIYSEMQSIIEKCQGACTISGYDIIYNPSIANSIKQLVYMYIQSESESESTSGSTRQGGEGGPNHLSQSSSARTAGDSGW